MKTFVDSVIKYLDDKFSANTTLSKKPLGHYAYEKDLVPTAVTPFYTVQLMDNSTASETFLAEATANYPLQINLYGVRMKVDKKDTDAQSVAYILADMCKAYMDEFKYSQRNIVQMRRTSCTPAMPYEDGSKAYYSAMRFNIILNKEN